MAEGRYEFVEVAVGKEGNYTSGYFLIMFAVWLYVLYLMIIKSRVTNFLKFSKFSQR